MRCMKSIKTQMMMWLLLGAVILFSGLGYYTQNRLDRLPEVIESLYGETASARADEVGERFKSYVDQVQMLAQTEVIQSMDEEAIKTFLPQVVLAEKERNLTVIWPDGRGISSRGLEIDASRQEQFEKIFLEGEDLWISSPFYSPYVDNGKPITIVSKAVTRDGQLVGLINAVLEIEFLNEVVRSVDVGETGYSWIMDQHGTVVAHPDAAFPLHRQAGDVFDEREEAWQTIQKNQDGFLQYSDQGTPMVSLYRSISHTPGWTFVIAISEEEMYRDIKAVSKAVLTAIGLGLVLVLVFTLAYSNTLSRPILNMKKAFEIAANGNLNVRADETIPNEVGEAAVSFNRMLVKIRQLTYQDPLTDLNNYHGFLLNLPYKRQQLEEKKPVTGLAIVSVDDFKRINSLSGYELGNEVLLTLAARIQEYLQPDECAARHFGDEFAVLLGAVDQGAFERRARELWEQCSTTLKLNENEYLLRTSMGTCLFQDGRSVDEVMNRATMAKLFVKKKGGNKVQYFDESLEAALIEEQDIEAELLHALEKKELSLAYQPVLDLRTRAITGFEALLRWQHPRHQQVPINRVIQLAEESGQIVEIGRWVMQEACKQAKHWHKLGYDQLVMAVNVSALQFEQPSFIETVGWILKETGLPAHSLELEITERIAMMGVQDKMNKMKQLKTMGVRLAIDDFGTGYSSLAYFAQFPIDTLKIDRSFISHMNSDPLSDTIVDTIITMAKGMKVNTIAEGVETEEHMIELQHKGCDKLQGYWFARPMTSEQGTHFLLENEK